MAVRISHATQSDAPDSGDGKISSNAWNEDHEIIGLDKTDVGLGNVDNTSDANKPVSTAQQAALDGKLAASAVDPDGTLAANSAARVPTQSAVVTYVAARLAALIAAAPGALDTLKELADAIGDDASFAATITNALAGKLAIASNLADLASPATARNNLGLGSAALESSSHFALATALRQLTAHTTFYVEAAGDDVNGDGSAGNPWATLQHAVDWLGATDFNGYDAFIQLGDAAFVGACINGLWSSRASLDGFAAAVLNNTSTLFIQGNAADASLASLTPISPAVPAILSIAGTPTVNIGIRNFTLDYTSPPDDGAIVYGFDTTLFIGDGTGSEMRAKSVTGDLFSMGQNSAVWHLDKLHIDGTFDFGFVMGRSGLYSYGAEMEFAPSTHFGGEFLRCLESGYAIFEGTTFTGSAVGGKRFASESGAVIEVTTAGSDLNTLPGDVAGTVSDGGSYYSATAQLRDGIGTAAALASDTDGTLAANSDTRIPTQKAIATYVAAKVAALINASPAALDTLKELADALGDDPNFATTITNALAGKQPLDADLTAIAALATTAFGRGVLTLADAAALRTLAGLAAVAASGSASDLGAGTLPAGRLPALAGDLSSVAGSNNVAVTARSKRTVFSASGTWTKDPRSVSVKVELYGAGGSGGGGTRTASGTANSGGGGGGGGSFKERTFDAAALGATEAITVGAGGAAPAAGASGSGGGNSSFGAWLTAYGGGGGAVGQSASNSGSGGGAGPGGAGGSTTTSAAGSAPNPGNGGVAGISGAGSAADNTIYGGGGGGGGGANGTAGGRGGRPLCGGGGGGGGGGVTVTPSTTNGSGGGANAVLANGDQTTPSASGGTAINYAPGRGGAGGSSAIGANIAGSGGDGQTPSGGGGGGGSALTTGTAGGGGKGGDGLVVVTEYY